MSKAQVLKCKGGMTDRAKGRGGLGELRRFGGLGELGMDGFSSLEGTLGA